MKGELRVNYKTKNATKLGPGFKNFDWETGFNRTLTSFLL